MASISVAPSRWLLLLAVVLCSLLLLFTQANEEINHAVVQLEQVDKLLTPMVALDKDQSLASFLSAQSVPLDFDLHPAAIATEGISEGNQLTEAIELEDEALFVEPTMEPSQEVTDETEAPNVVIDTLPGPGWLYIEKFEVMDDSSTACQSSDKKVVALDAMPTGKCSPDEKQLGRSVMYGCDQNSGYVLLFSGSQCSLQSLIDVEVIPLTCNDADLKYYKCTSDTDFPIPVDAPFIVTSYFFQLEAQLNPTSCSGVPDMIRGELDNVCVPAENVGSVYNEYPYMRQFSSADCGGNSAIAIMFPTVCTEATSDEGVVINQFVISELFNSMEIPTMEPTEAATEEHTFEETVEDTMEGTMDSTLEPSMESTLEPTFEESSYNSFEPSVAETEELTEEDTEANTLEPTIAVTVNPSHSPTEIPTKSPTVEPTTVQPSRAPTQLPSAVPTADPTFQTTNNPSRFPTVAPSHFPTVAPSLVPVAVPSLVPVAAPTLVPVAVPSLVPVAAPSLVPVAAPTLVPVAVPSLSPVGTPSLMPVSAPSLAPVTAPSLMPVAVPSFVPTAAPSISPTAKPTASPSFFPSAANTPTVAPTTSVKQSLSFTVEQSFKGISKEQYFADIENNNRAFKKTVVTLLKGVDEENIRIDEIKDITGRRQLLASGNVKVLADTGVVIIYTIIIPDTLSAGFTNANDAFAQVKQQLQEATSSGDFTSKLQSIAQELGVTILATVVAGDLTVSEPVIITIPVPPENTSNESSDKDELNDGEIAGIVIGCVVFTGLVVGLLYYYYSHHWNKQGSGKVQPADIPMASVVPGSSSSIMPISEDQMKLVKTGSNTLAV